MSKTTIQLTNGEINELGRHLENFEIDHNQWARWEVFT